MTDNEIVLRIQELMDGVEWSPDTLDEIAQLLRTNGYPVADLDPVTDAERANGPRRRNQP